MRRVEIIQELMTPDVIQGLESGAVFIHLPRKELIHRMPVGEASGRLHS